MLKTTGDTRSIAIFFNGIPPSPSCRHGVIFAVATSSTWGNSNSMHALLLFALKLRTHMSVIKKKREADLFLPDLTLLMLKQLCYFEQLRTILILLIMMHGRCSSSVFTHQCSNHTAPCSANYYQSPSQKSCTCKMYSCGSTETCRFTTTAKTLN